MDSCMKGYVEWDIEDSAEERFSGADNWCNPKSRCLGDIQIIWISKFQAFEKQQLCQLVHAGQKTCSGTHFPFHCPFQT